MTSSSDSRDTGSDKPIQGNDMSELRDKLENLDIEFMYGVPVLLNEKAVDDLLALFNEYAKKRETLARIDEKNKTLAKCFDDGYEPSRDALIWHGERNEELQSSLPTLENKSEEVV